MGDGHESVGDPALSGVWRELDALVTEVLAAREAVAAAQATETRLLARAVGLVEQRTAERRARGLKIDNDLPLREVAAELGTAMRVADRTAQRRISDAHTLVTRFALTFVAWQAGRIERAHAAIIADEGVIITDDRVRAEYEELVVAIAEVESAGRLREIARAIASRLDPESADEQRHNAVQERRVAVYDLGDGLARLIADLPAPLAYAIVDRLTEQAQTIHDIERADAEPVRALAPRTLDQIRADVLADTLLTGTPTAHVDDDRLAGLPAIRGTVRVTIPLATLAGVADEPALLDGVGPVDPHLVRQIAAAAPGWDRVYLDGSTGLPVAVDRYRPSAALTRYLEARDERCRFPGCRRPAEKCDQDHTIAAVDGGPTSACNLGNFCRRHHTLKHATPWRVEQVVGGQFRWTSPTGRVYTDFAPATLRYLPSRQRPKVSFDEPPDDPAPF